MLGNLLGGSALTDSSISLPEGHYAEDSMKATVVPESEYDSPFPRRRSCNIP
jgi:7-cyano-7-deazaguanine synthase in queuosine biosynthesis